MIAEPIDGPDVPKRIERVDCHRLAQRDPDVLRHEILASEVIETQVLRLADRLRVLTQPAVERVAWIVAKADPSLPRARAHRLADIDRRTGAVRRGDRRV